MEKKKEKFRITLNATDLSKWKCELPITNGGDCRNFKFREYQEFQIYFEASFGHSKWQFKIQP